MYVPIILGTARKGRQSEKVANFVLGEAKKAELDSEIVDVRDYRIDATDNSGESPQAVKLAEKIKKANALVVVAPEYNFNIPGELKMMLDMLYREYSGLPVGIVAVSAGDFGGVRAAQEMKLICVNFCMKPSCETLFFPKVQEQFDENGKMKNEKYYKRASRFLERLMENSRK